MKFVQRALFRSQQWIHTVSPPASEQADKVRIGIAGYNLQQRAYLNSGMLPPLPNHRGFWETLHHPLQNLQGA